MIGLGEYAMFREYERGEKVMIHDGSIIEAGLTLEEERKKFIRKKLNLSLIILMLNRK